MFYTTLTTIDNKHVIIPNGKLSNSTIINVTARNLRKLEIKVGISYDSDIKKAKKLLQHILALSAHSPLPQAYRQKNL